MCRDRDMNPWNKDSLFIVKSVYLYIYTQKIYIEKQNQFLLERNKVISHSEEISSFTKKKKLMFYNWSIIVQKIHQFQCL